jgi:hypothetical protein
MWTTVARTKRRGGRKIPTPMSFGSAPPLSALEFGEFRHGFFLQCSVFQLFLMEDFRSVVRRRGKSWAWHCRGEFTLWRLCSRLWRAYRLDEPESTNRLRVPELHWVKVPWVVWHYFSLNVYLSAHAVKIRRRNSIRLLYQEEKHEKFKISIYS